MGKQNNKRSITDVPGVKVGHVTLSDGPIQTGITVIQPAPHNIFQKKLMAEMTVFNGFGKSVGLMQIDELGTLETPIVLTNTFAVGTASTALTKYMVEKNPGIGRQLGSVNPVVLECNDGYLNDLQQFAVKESHVLKAINKTDHLFEQGAVGAGRGMSCYQLKGGIGSHSKQIQIVNDKFVVGALVLTNMGKMEELRLPDDIDAGKKIAELDPSDHGTKDKGSIIIVIATDMPLLPYQLKRASQRAINGIARTGATLSNGSGEIALAFSTANTIEHDNKKQMGVKCYNNSQLDALFAAIVDVVEISILKSLAFAEDVTGFKGHTRYTINNYREELL